MFPFEAYMQVVKKVCKNSRLPEATIMERVRPDTGLLRLESELRYHNDSVNRTQEHVVGILSTDQLPLSQRAPLLKGRFKTRMLTTQEQTAITKMLISELEPEEQQTLHLKFDDAEPEHASGKDAICHWKPSQEEPQHLHMSEQQAVSEVDSRCSSYPIVFVRGMHLRTKSADDKTITQDSGIAASFF